MRWYDEIFDSREACQANWYRRANVYNNIPGGATPIRSLGIDCKYALIKKNISEAKTLEDLLAVIQYMKTRD